MPEISPEQIEELREAFTLFDNDGDGFISIEELACVMRSLGKNPSEEELNAIINVNIYFRLREILKFCDLSMNASLCTRYSTKQLGGVPTIWNND